MDAVPELRTKIMDTILSERAQRLFLKSDLERKGFIVKRDMQRMRSEIPLSPEQLEAVFDSLDVKGNGYLTIEQFLEGFGQFLNSHSASNGTKSRGRLRNEDKEDLYVADSEEDSEISTRPAEENHLEYLLEELHSTNVLHSVGVLRQLCRRVRREGSPQIQHNLESFLQQLTRDLQRKQHEHWELEASMRVREEEHNKQVQKLFEEMEVQLSEEKENLMRQEEERLRLSKKVLEDELSQKEDFLRDVLSERQDLSEQLRTVRARESSAKQEYLELTRGKAELEAKMERQCREVYRLQRDLDHIQRDDTLKKQNNLSLGFRLARGIMLEQQGLLQQLQLVREMVSTISQSHSALGNDKGDHWHVEDKSRTYQENTQYPSIDTTSGFLDDYEYDEDFCHPVFQRQGTSLSTYGTTSDYDMPSLQDEIAFSQSQNKYNSLQNDKTPISKSL